MPAITYIQPDGSRRSVEVPAGTTVMQAAVSNGIVGIVGECGGSAMCATCHVYVDTDYLDGLRQYGGCDLNRSRSRHSSPVHGLQDRWHFND